jgi:hypothetical protein
MCLGHLNPQIDPLPLLPGFEDEEEEEDELDGLEDAASQPVRCSPRHLADQVYDVANIRKYAKAVYENLLNTAKNEVRLPARQNTAISKIANLIPQALIQKNGMQYISLTKLREIAAIMHAKRKPAITAGEYARLVHVIFDPTAACAAALEDMADKGAQSQEKVDKNCALPKQFTCPFTSGFAGFFNDTSQTYPHVQADNTSLQCVGTKFKQDGTSRR